MLGAWKQCKLPACDGCFKCRPSQWPSAIALSHFLLQLGIWVLNLTEDLDRRLEPLVMHHRLARTESLKSPNIAQYCTLRSRLCLSERYAMLHRGCPGP